MAQYIDKSALVAEIEGLKVHSEEAIQEFGREGYMDNVLFEQSKIRICETLISFLNTIEVKEVDLIIHTIIAECCDWLAMNTNISHDKIEDCRNLMLTVKEEQFKGLHQV